MGKRAFALAFLALGLSPCFGWGHDGHLYICALAQGLLSDEAAVAVKELLPPWAAEYMPSVCSWADLVGHTAPWRWSLPLHYIDTPDFACNYNFARDCHYGPRPRACAAAAILNYTSQLKGAKRASTGGDLLGKELLSSLGRGADPADAMSAAQPSWPRGPLSMLTWERRVWSWLSRRRGFPEKQGLVKVVLAQAGQIDRLSAVGARIGPSLADREAAAGAGSAQRAAAAAAAAAKEMLQAAGMGTVGDYDPVEASPTVALMFLVHFVGDIHQPLHVGFTSDYGGNRIKVRWYKWKANLHEVWDTEIIKHGVWAYHGNKPADFVVSLANRLSSEWAPLIPEWAACSTGPACPNIYAQESIKNACTWAYRNATPGAVLGDEYFKSRFPVVELALAKAAVRLAAALNRIFAPASAGIPRV